MIGATAARGAAGTFRIVAPQIRHTITQRLDLTSPTQLTKLSVSSGSNTGTASSEVAAGGDVPSGQVDAVRLNNPGTSGSAWGITLPGPWDLTNSYLRITENMRTAVSTTGKSMTVRLADSAAAYAAGNFLNYAVRPNSALLLGTANWLPLNAWVADAIDPVGSAVVGTGVANLAAIGYVVIRLDSVSGQTLTLSVARLEVVTKVSPKAKCVFWHDDTVSAGALALSSRLSAYGWTFTEATEWDMFGSTVYMNLSDALAYQVAGAQFGSHATSNAEHVSSTTPAQIIDQARRNIARQQATTLRGAWDFAWWGGLPALPLNIDAMQAVYRTSRYNTSRQTVPEQLPPAMPHLYKSLLVDTADTFTGLFKTYVDNAIATKGLASFVFHQDIAAPGQSNALTTELNTLLAYLDANRASIDVVTAHQAFASSAA